MTGSILAAADKKQQALTLVMELKQSAYTFGHAAELSTTLGGSKLALEMAAQATKR